MYHFGDQEGVRLVYEDGDYLRYMGADHKITPLMSIWIVYNINRALYVTMGDDILIIFTMRTSWNSALMVVHRIAISRKYKAVSQVISP